MTNYIESTMNNSNFFLLSLVQTVKLNHDFLFLPDSARYNYEVRN